VAVSGGPDSVALLHALTLLREEQGWQVQAGHVNHQLRGEESDGDEVFVREFCKVLQVPLHLIRLDVREATTEVTNLEARARQKRYAWLREIAEQHGLAWIATGHQREDQAETVLHHLLRGTGLRGLRGIAALRPWGERTFLVRPFLTVSRQQILAYLVHHGLAFRQDRTNADTNLMRNRLRHELLPLLRERFHPEATDHLAQVAEQAVQWQDYISSQAAVLLQQVEKPRVGTLLVLERAVLAQAPPLLVREAFHLLWEREGWPCGEMSQAHWQRVIEVARGQRSACDMPGGVHLRCRDRVVQVGPRS
jgi:tRNA(Ile)-lysidine synthase